MIICSNSNIDIIQGVIGYGDAEGITDWRISNTNDGILNILNSISNNTRITINTNGNVGIGSKDPSTITDLLDVSGNINISGIYEINGRDVINDTSNYVQSTSNILVNRIVSSATGGGGTSQWTNVSSGIFYNTSNVGIGTSFSNSKLHIYDTSFMTKLTIQNIFTSSTITSSPLATFTGTAGTGGIYKYMAFTYTTETGGAGSGQTLYTISVSAAGILCDILIVGGGGGGGAGHGGGGGAGQLILIRDATLSSGSYTIRVGKGGIGAVSTSDVSITTSTKGSNSTFHSVIAEGGGTDSNTSSDKDGGSGAGGDGYPADGGTIGFGNKNTTTDTYTSGIVYSRGNNGGSSVGFVAGGGGGAGTAGNGSFAGDGLSGISEIGYDFKANFGTSVGKTESDGLIWFAGGGGGGAAPATRVGGLGGGGNGAYTGNGTNALNNTGSGGGGGAGSSGDGGLGGHGVVIIRFLAQLPQSSIDLIRGTSGDSNIDYKIGNYDSEFKIISSVNNVDTDYVKITSTGAIYNPTGTSSWTTASDRRIKENIEDASYEKCYDNINRLGLYRFNYIDGFNNVNKDIKQLGFIAQEVNEIFPKSVLLNNNYNIPDLLTIDITQINYTLYGAVKKLIKQNEDKDRRIKRLETLLNIEGAPITSNIAIDTSNIAIDTSNIAIDTSNITIDTSNIAIDTSNIAIDTSNITIDTSNIPIDTSNIAIDTSNIATE